MKKQERILKNLKGSDVQFDKHMTSEAFIDNANRYIKAIKEGRVICSIGSVNNSGMSRTIKFLECSRTNGNEYQYLNFQSLFRALGFKTARNTYDYFHINGCGMNMIFHTNYTIIHRLRRLGFISKKQCDSLAQNAPSVI